MEGVVGEIEFRNRCRGREAQPRLDFELFFSTKGPKPFTRLYFIVGPRPSTGRRRRSPHAPSVKDNCEQCRRRPIP
jgi:hypothetical protein